MRAVLKVNCWTRAWGLTLLSLGISYDFPAQAQQSPITDAAAQGSAPQKHDAKHHHYQLVQIPTLGGPGTNFFDNTNNIAVLNARGVVSGGAADTKIPDPYAPAYWWSNGNITHAFRWQNGTLTNLGALPGTNNSGSAWISANGLIAGLSENGQIDPSVKDLPEISAVMWRDGKITNLGSLPGGGYQSAAVSVNNRGEVVGVATNLVPDSNSLLQRNPNLWSGVPYGYQLRAFIWDQESGMQDLGTLGTGTDAEALKINGRGQVIGDSYLNSEPSPVCAAVGLNLVTGTFLWENGEMTNLGSFGGTCTVPGDLNEHGQVVGGSYVKGDAYQRAFIWQNGSFRDLGGSLGGNNTGAIAINENGESVGFGYLAGEITFHATLWRAVGQMTDLGTVGSDPCSFAQGVNDEGQVVGDSTPSDCQNFNTSRAFLWEHGSIVDLNTLVPPKSPLYLLYAYTINNRGEIAVNGRDAHGIEQAALLIPCDEDHADVEGCDYDLVEEAAATQQTPASVMQKQTTMTPSTPALNGPSNDVRTMLRGRLGFNRFMGNAQQVALSGTASTSGPIATLSDTRLAFWPEAIGTASGAWPVTLKNTGTTSLTISRIAISGPNAGDFTQTHTCGSSLAAGASCEVDVTFKATQIGNRTAILSVSDNAHGSPQTVSLSGSGTDVVLSPTSLGFYCIPHLIICSCVTSRTATLTNVGSTTLKISGVAVSSGPFSQTNSCGTSVAAGGSCSIKVRWSPSTQVGSSGSGLVSISDNGGASPQNLPLRGYKRCSAH
jgi:probable HAF family extracellular repeat protein